MSLSDTCFQVSWDEDTRVAGIDQAARDLFWLSGES